jgi:hypothetical protein
LAAWANIFARLRAEETALVEGASPAHHVADMAKRSSRSLPMMMAQLTFSSWETIYRRSLMMARGTCSPAEYQRMVGEKAAALQASTLALMTGRGRAAALSPYLVRSRANAKRLRKK